MATPAKGRTRSPAQDDPGVTNDPKSSAGGYDAHAWHSLNQIFERLGKMDQKIDQLGVDQGKLKDSVDKHDKYVNRVIFTFAGIVLVLGALWFIYSNFLKDRITLTPVKPESAINAPKNVG
jgi:hypothetical protein